MHTTCRKVENVATARMEAVELRHHIATLNLTAEGVFVRLVGESRIEDGIRLGMNDVPQLGLADALMAAKGEIVVGMHLNGQVLGGIDKFHHNGEHVAVLCISVGAHKLRSKFMEKRLDVAAGIDAVAHNRFLTRHTCQFPTLANRVGRISQLLQLTDFVTAPNHGFQVWLKLQWVYIQRCIHIQSILSR